MNSRGQAMIEVAVFMLFTSGLMVGLVVFTQWILLHQKLLLTAKQGIHLYSSGRFEKSDVERHMRRYLATSPPWIDPSRVHIEIKPQEGVAGYVYRLDRVSVQYTPSRAWFHWLGELGTIEEVCVVAHAPTYAASYQPWYGPAVPW